MIVECQNDTNKVCEPQNEIQQFIRQTRIQLTVQDHKVNDKIYKNEAKIFDRQGDYFPITRSWREEFFGYLRDYNSNDLDVLYKTMSFGIDYVEYDDSYIPTFWNSKKLEMLNIKNKS